MSYFNDSQPCFHENSFIILKGKAGILKNRFTTIKINLNLKDRMLIHSHQKVEMTQMATNT